MMNEDRRYLFYVPWEDTAPKICSPGASQKASPVPRVLVTPNTKGHSWEIAAECGWAGAVGVVLILIVAGGMDLRACRPQHHQGVFNRGEFLITQECDKVCFTWLSKSLHILRDGTLDMLHTRRECLVMYRPRVSRWDWVTTA